MCPVVNGKEPRLGFRFDALWFSMVHVDNVAIRAG